MTDSKRRILVGTDHRPPWECPLGDLFAIPVHLDPEVPAGTAVFDLDPEEPRHITGIRVHDRGEFELTDEQYEQVRDHYRAMDERAARALVDYQRLMDRLTSEPQPSRLTRQFAQSQHPAVLTAPIVADPGVVLRITDI